MDKVYVVYDPLCERVISTHKTEKGALKRAIKENIKKDRNEEDVLTSFQYEEFDLED